MTCRLFNQVPIESQVLSEQVFSALGDLVEIKDIMRLITSKCAGEFAKSK